MIVNQSTHHLTIQRQSNFPHTHLSVCLSIYQQWKVYNVTQLERHIKLQTIVQFPLNHFNFYLDILNLGIQEEGFRRGHFTLQTLVQTLVYKPHPQLSGIILEKTSEKALS